MELKIRKKIIDLYKLGKSSLLISKEIGVSKPTILRVLNEEGVVRKKDRCKSLNINKDEKGYYVCRSCPKCKKEIKTRSKDKTIACRNHFNKLKGTSLCKSCSLTLQVGEGNPFYGKKHTKESKIKISKNRKGKAKGENNSMSNKEHKERARKNLKKKWDSGQMEHARKIMSNTLKESRRKGKIKSGITSKKEKEIIKEISKIGYKSKQSFKVDTKICDIYIEELNLIIEYFGDYWHCNPKKYEENYFNKKKNMTAKEIWDYDSKKIDLIKSYGYNLIVIWESDLENDDKLINKLIENHVKSN